MNEATTIRYAFLTTGVLQALRAREGLAGNDVSDRHALALRRGVELLGDMTRGVAWISGDTTLGYDSATVSLSLLALRVLTRLEIGSEAEARQVLLQMRKALEEPTDPSGTEVARQFFDFLSRELSHGASACG